MSAWPTSETDRRDAPYILCGAVIQRDRALADRALKILPTTRWWPPAPVAARVDLDEDELAMAATRHLARDVLDETARNVLSWTGTAVHAGDLGWNHLITGLAKFNWKKRLDDTLVLPALTTVARERPERFEELAASLGPTWQSTFDRVRTLIAQLDEAQRGKLHPELEQLRLKLESKS
jgi:hypothetical protein